MKRTHKWPAKALNLLVAMAMVISMVAVLAPAVVAQTPPGPNPDPECDPVQQFDGCNLEVFVQTYAKDMVTGDFTQTNTFDEGDCFYVNAVVVNTGNVKKIAPEIDAYFCPDFVQGCLTFRYGLMRSYIFGPMPFTRKSSLPTDIKFL